jgi:hypothetical protein
MHLAVARALPSSYFGDVDRVVSMVARDDPDSRGRALYIVTAGWFMFALAFLAVGGIMGFLVRAVAGDVAGKVVFSVMEGAACFCLAGCVHVVRRWYWYLPKARTRLRGGDRPAYEEYMRLALPRDSSAVFQSAIGILVAVIVFASV